MVVTRNNLKTYIIGRSKEWLQITEDGEEDMTRLINGNFSHKLILKD